MSKIERNLQDERKNGELFNDAIDDICLLTFFTQLLIHYRLTHRFMSIYILSCFDVVLSVHYRLAQLLDILSISRFSLLICVAYFHSNNLV